MNIVYLVVVIKEHYNKSFTVFQTKHKAELFAVTEAEKLFDSYDFLEKTDIPPTSKNLIMCLYSDYANKIWILEQNVQ